MNQMGNQIGGPRILFQVCQTAIPVERTRIHTTGPALGEANRTCLVE